MRKALILGLVACAGVVASAAMPALDLAKVDSAIAALKAKETDRGATAVQRFKAKYERLKLELLVCEDAAFEGKRREMTAHLSEPGECPTADYVSFLFASVGRDATRQMVFTPPDLLALAEKASRGDEKARLAYFTGAIRHYEQMLAFDLTALEERYSREAQLAFIDRSLQDPLLAKARGQVLEAKVGVLRSLDRKADAEKLMVASAAESDAFARRFLPLLAAAYAEDAQRFYGEPDRPTLTRAAETLACYFVLKDVARRDRNGFQKACELRGQIELARGNPQEAIRWAEWLVAVRGGETNAVAAVLIGDAAYAAGDWNRAADAYAVAGDKLQWRVRERFARALFAAGRKQEALVQIELTALKAGKYKRRELKHAAEKISQQMKGNDK